MNVTVVDGENPTTGGGYVTVYPCGKRPDASNLNFTSGQTIPNSVLAPVSANGTICFYVYGTAHLLADVSGYFATPNTVGFKFVDQSGIPILGAGLLWCNRTVDPACPQAFFIGSDAAGIARLALDRRVLHDHGPRRRYGLAVPGIHRPFRPHVPLRGSRAGPRRELCEPDDLDHRQTGSLRVLIAESARRAYTTGYPHRPTLTAWQRSQSLRRSSPTD